MLWERHSNEVIEEACKGARVSTGHTAVETKKVRWPSSLTNDDCGSSSPVRSQKKGRNQAPGTIYSSRKLTTARGVTPQDVRQLRTTDDIQPIEVECSAQAEVIQEPRPQRTAAVLPTTEVQSSKQVLLSTMLSRFDLQDDVQDLAKSQNPASGSEAILPIRTRTSSRTFCTTEFRVGSGENRRENGMCENSLTASPSSWDQSSLESPD